MYTGSNKYVYITIFNTFNTSIYIYIYIYIYISIYIYLRILHVFDIIHKYVLY